MHHDDDLAASESAMRALAEQYARERREQCWRERREQREQRLAKIAVEFATIMEPTVSERAMADMLAVPWRVPVL